MAALYADDMTMREARDRYFQRNGFGEDGGYNDAWVDFELGPLPLPFPNTPGRIKAVKFHDLHHVLTGYETNALGEFEISAWEIGAGCTSIAAAWVINMSGLATGVLVEPRRIFAAFMRGRRSRTLYGETFEPLLDCKVGELRERFVDDSAVAATAVDVVRFVGTALLGSVIGLTFAAAMLPFVPIGLLRRVLSSPAKQSGLQKTPPTPK
jgi:hypothetical protein